MIETIRQRTGFYGAVLLLSLAAGLTWLLLVPSQPFSDFQYYHELATQIAQGGPWGDTYTAVGYPIFLALFYWLLTPALWVAKAVNLLLLCLNNWLASGILRRLPLPERVRRTVFLVFALFPINLYYTSIVGTELFFTSLLMTLLWLYLGELRSKYIWMGLLTGVASMVKPFFPGFFLVLLLTEGVVTRRFWAAAGKSLLVLALAGLVLAPWLYRNYRLVGEFTYISNNGGIVLYINNNSQNTTGGWMPAADVANTLVTTAEYQAANMTERNRMLSQAAKLWIKAHPEEFLVLGLKRLCRTFLLPSDIYYSLHGAGVAPATEYRLTRAVEWVRIPVYVGGCLAALLASLRYLWWLLAGRLPRQNGDQSRAEIALLLVCWMFTAVYFLTEGQSRYAFPLIFPLAYFSCQAGFALLAGGRQFSRRLIPVAGLRR